MSASMVIAAGAAQQAHSAQVTACQTLMPQFSGATATADQARTYAKCVDLIYPGPASTTEVFFIKVMIVAALIGLAIGVYKAHSEKWGRDWSTYLVYGLVGTIGGPAILFFGALLWTGVKYLFTA